jgi:hypothetical protein
MFTNIPSIAFFAILQSVDIIRYFLQRRLETLKTETWKIYDDKNSLGTVMDDRLSVEILSKEFQRQIRNIEFRIKLLKILTSNWTLILSVILFLIVFLIFSLFRSALLHKFCSIHSSKFNHKSKGVSVHFKIILQLNR